LSGFGDHLSLKLHRCSPCFKVSKYVNLFSFLLFVTNISQRLKGTIESKIAEEQAKAKAAAASPARPVSTARRSASIRNESPSKRSRARPKEVDDGTRGPDPSIFEGAFVIEDDSEEPSRAGTPAIPETKPEVEENGTATEKAVAGEGEGVHEKVEVSTALKPSITTDLPADVRSKLRKLDKLEARYQGMLYHN
jgi:hypothetical protein